MGKRSRRVLLGMLATVLAGSTAAAIADHPQPIDRLGRWAGCGWGDGYHACKSSGIQPGADLPPRDYAASFGARRILATAAAHHQTRPCGTTFYDQFDRACDSAGCDSVGCDTPGCDTPGCDSLGCDSPAWDGMPPSVIESHGNTYGNKLGAPVPVATNDFVPSSAPQMLAPERASSSGIAKPMLMASAPRSAKPLPLPAVESVQPVSLGQTVRVRISNTPEPISLVHPDAEPVLVEPVLVEPAKRVPPNRLPQVSARPERVAAAPRRIGAIPNRLPAVISDSAVLPTTLVR